MKIGMYWWYFICFYIINVGIWLVWGEFNFGRVEVLYYGCWGIVCNDNFNNNVVKVVCWMFGKFM